MKAAIHIMIMIHNYMLDSQRDKNISYVNLDASRVNVQITPAMV